MFLYLLLDANCVDAGTRNNEVGIWFRDTIPNHVCGSFCSQNESVVLCESDDSVGSTDKYKVLLDMFKISGVDEIFLRLTEA